MRLRKECKHGRYDDHFVYETDEPCPGGEFLPEGALVIEKEDGEWPESVVDELFGPIYYHFGSEDAPECRDLAVKLLDALASQVGEV